MEKNDSKITLRKAAYYVVILLCLAGLVAVILATTGRQNDTNVVTADNWWDQSAATQQSVAGTAASPQPAPEPPELLQQKAAQLESFIGIDLAAKQLYWYENGSVARTFPVLNSPETEDGGNVPSGQYEISYRNDRHLSTTGAAFLPHIQQFTSGYAIHGWPIQRNGEPVPSDFSGGSLWLSSSDAETVYRLATDGTPVVITDESSEKQAMLPPLPQVTAKSYVVADVATGHIFARKDARRPFSIASISKLLTAIVAEDVMADSDNVYISQNAVSTYGRAGGLTAGQSLPFSTLQYPLLLDSSNDAATAIAEHTGFDSFMNKMNRKAVTIGMESTSFADPSGLSDDNISTARDLFQLSRYLYNRRPEILEITTKTFQTTPDPYSDGLRNYTNNHPMAGQRDFRGGKNGYTGNARYTLLSIFSTESDGAERDIAIIILGSENYADDTRRLLRWVKRVI